MACYSSLLLSLLAVATTVVHAVGDGGDSEGDEVAANRRNLARQYSALPYPERKREDGFGIHSVDLATVSSMAFGGRYGSVWRRSDLRILDAGGGTGDAALTLAKQLHDIGNRDARIVHLDLSPTAQDIARDRADYNGVGHMIEFRNGGFLDEVLMDSLGKFDFILSHGVLHHQTNPAKGLLSLKRALKPGGAISVMVYGELGRTGIYDVQRMMRLMKETASGDEHEEVESLRSLLGALPGISRVKRNDAFWASVLAEVSTGAGAFDLFLHSQDRAYTVPELYEWVEEECGLKIASFNERGLYDPMLWLDGATDELADRVRGLDVREKMTMAELLHGAILRHSFYLFDETSKTPNSARRTQPRVAADSIPCVPRGGKVEEKAYEIFEHHSDFTVDVARNVKPMSNVFMPGTTVRYKNVSMLIQFPWIYGNCQLTFEDIWRDNALPVMPNLTLSAYLAAMGGIVKMLGDWGNLVILTEPGELLEPETFSRTEFSGNDEL